MEISSHSLYIYGSEQDSHMDRCSTPTNLSDHSVQTSDNGPASSDNNIQNEPDHQPMPTKSTKEKLVMNNTPPPIDLKEKAHRHSEAPKATNNNNLATSIPEPLIAPSFSGHMEISIDSLNDSELNELESSLDGCSTSDSFSDAMKNAKKWLKNKTNQKPVKTVHCP